MEKQHIVAVTDSDIWICFEATSWCSGLLWAVIDYALSCGLWAQEELRSHFQKICFHEASNKSLIEWLSLAGKQINDYEGIDKVVTLCFKNRRCDDRHPQPGSVNHMSISLFPRVPEGLQTLKMVPLDLIYSSTFRQNRLKSSDGAITWISSINSYSAVIDPESNRVLVWVPKWLKKREKSWSTGPLGEKWDWATGAPSGGGGPWGVWILFPLNINII